LARPIPSVAPPLDERGVRERTRADDVTFTDFYNAHVAFVWRNVRRLAGLDCPIDDIVQDVFLVVLRRLPEFEARSSISTWLYGIIRNVVRDHRRARPAARRPRDSVDLELLVDPEAHESVERAQTRRALHAVLQKLDENRREVFILAELEQMTAAEISEALGINETTVYARLRDARHDFELAAQRQRARDYKGAVK
jgi:RNA polymerase sigma-70 factor (ECF subfamily)